MPVDKKQVLCNLDLIIAAISLVILIVVTFGGVIMRYCVGSPLIWAEEVQLWSFLWLTFCGAGAAFRYGSHVAVEMVVDLFPKNIKKIIEFIDLLIVVIVLAYLTYLGGDIIKLMLKIGKSTNILHIPFWFINGIMPVSCVVMIISAIFAYKQNLNKDDTAENEENA